jgi:DNA repair protein RecN (Recombination protein N)
LSEYQKDYELLNELTHNYNSLKSKIEKEESESDYIKFQLNQLKEARLSPGELEELEEEQLLLNNAESIKKSLLTISNLISLKDQKLQFCKILKKLQLYVPN